MEFGEKKIEHCVGCTLAHSFAQGDLRIKKGTKLTHAHIKALKTFDVKTLIVAALDETDFDEDEAANFLSQSCLSKHIICEEAFTGRVNFFAKTAGMFLADRALVDQFNQIHPAITLATLDHQSAVEQGRMVGTLKIIPFAAPREACDKIHQILTNQGAPFWLEKFTPKRVGLIATKLPHLKQSVMDKTIKTLKKRLDFAKAQLNFIRTVEHNSFEVSAAIKESCAEIDLLILFGASATMDEMDVVPMGIEEAGGEILRFGMPVDPGNLLVLAKLHGLDVLGAPGCARSISENGFDFVLNRLLSNQKLEGSDIAKMGVGGLLKEIHSRPQPRLKTARKGDEEAPKIAALILAGGQSRRMGEENKLLMPYKGEPMVSHVVRAAQNSKCSAVHMVVGHEADRIKAALQNDTLNEHENNAENEHENNVDINWHENSAYNEGLSTSLKCGVAALKNDYDGILVLLGDMPMISSEMLDKMILQFNKAAAPPNAGSSIVQAMHNGKGGNPVIWGANYFDALLKLDGDMGARPLINQYQEAVFQVEIGRAASFDVDTKTAFEVLQSL